MIHDEILILDCGTSPLSLDTLQLAIRPDLIERVKYSQCFDIEGVDQSFEFESNDIQRLIIIIGIKDMFTTAKVNNFDETHRLVNKVMLKIRKFRVDNGDVVLLETGDETTSVLDYYTDISCVINKGEVMIV